MTAVVSDTSPLNYLVLIDAVGLLPRLFSEVFVPTIVAEELARTKTPQQVREWIAAPPPWLQIREPIQKSHGFKLDPGEAQAIMLARELGIPSLLIDERKGFHVAEALGLHPFGLLGVLELCASRGWIDFDHYLRGFARRRFVFMKV